MYVADPAVIELGEKHTIVPAEIDFVQAATEGDAFVDELIDAGAEAVIEDAEPGPVNDPKATVPTSTVPLIEESAHNFAAVIVAE